MNNLSITLCQHDIVWGDILANRHQVEACLANVPAGTDLFVVPETFTTGFGEHMASLAEPVDGPTLQWARQMAAKHHLLFVGTWVVSEGGRCYNRLHWVFPDGTFGQYDKAHTFRVSGEADQIARGTQRKVFEYKGWRIRPAVCYDLRFPKWLRNKQVTGGVDPATATLDYDLLLVCANWPASRHEAWTTLLRARAIENLCYVVGCNRLGTDAHGSLYSGNSAVVDYKGTILTEEAPLIATTLDRERLLTFRQHWPFYLDFD